MDKLSIECSVIGKRGDLCSLYGCLTVSESYSLLGAVRWGPKPRRIEVEGKAPKLKDRGTGRNIELRGEIIEVTKCWSHHAAAWSNILSATCSISVMLVPRCTQAAEER